MTDGPGAWDAEEARAYLAEVLKELRRRESALAKARAEVSAVEAKLAALSLSRGLRQGRSLSVASGESYKGTLRKRLLKLRREAAELEEEVRRARERRQLVEEELAAAGAGE